MRIEDPDRLLSLRRGLRRVARPFVHELEHAVGGELEETLGAIEQALADLALGEGTPTGFNPDLHLAPGVPRIRALLVVLAAHAAGGDSVGTKEVAFSAEMLHLAVAVHDAALGRAGGRRRRVARRLIGGAAHWLGGNHLTLRALEIARHAPAPEIMGEVLDTLREFSEGHALTEDLRNRPADAQDYRDYAESHTGALFAFCTRAGAHLAGANRPVVSALGRYGVHMGVAWHALEDQWRVTLPPDELPSFMAHVALSGRPVLPLIHALERDAELEPLFDRLLAFGEPDDARAFTDRVVRAGGLSAARRLVLQETLAARRALRNLPPSPERDTLDRIAAGLAASGAPGPSAE